MKKIFITLILLTIYLQGSFAFQKNERIVVFDDTVCTVQEGGWSCAGKSLEQAEQAKIVKIQSELKGVKSVFRKNKIIDYTTDSPSEKRKTVLLGDNVCIVKEYGWYCNHGYLSKKDNIKLERIRQKLNK